MEGLQVFIRPCQPDNIPPSVGRGGAGNSLVMTPGRVHKACSQSFDQWTARIAKEWKDPSEPTLAAQKTRLAELEALAEACRDLVKGVDLVCQLSSGNRRSVDSAAIIRSSTASAIHL